MTLVGNRPVPGLDDLTVTGFAFALGGCVLMAIVFAVGGAGSLGFAPRPASVGLLIALGTGPTAVAYTSYFRGLRNSAASTAALLSLLEPLTGTILAVLLLGNRLSPAGIVGAGTLATAVLLTVIVDRSGQISPRSIHDQAERSST
jgi:DME family drug/metabolite transporter